MVKWTREKVIRAILSRESQGLPLVLGRREGVDQALYQAGARIFGSWPNALMAAGIAPERAQTKDRWPPGRILSVIRSLSRRRRPLRPGELKERYSYVLHAARRCFGSWSKALIAAGVDPLKLRRVPPWTKERVIEAILTRALRNEPLGSRTVRPRSLAEAGAKIFGTWALALTAAGLDPQRYRNQTASADDSLDASSSARHEKPPETAVGTVAGCEANAETVAAEGDARSTDGGRAVRSWSNPAVLQAILARLHASRVMNAKAVYHDDRPLYRAATRRFGNWSNALRAAGLNPDQYRKYPRGSNTGHNAVTGGTPPGLNESRT